MDIETLHNNPIALLLAAIVLFIIYVFGGEMKRERLSRAMKRERLRGIILECKNGECKKNNEWKVRFDPLWPIYHFKAKLFRIIICKECGRKEKIKITNTHSVIYIEQV